MIRFEDIYETVRRHHPGADLDLLRKAYVFSAVEHKGQTRASGEPYLVHPLEVAAILAEMRMDPACVAVGLLHDVLEDTLTEPDRIKEYFGPDVLHIVEGVTKISKIPFTTSEERQAETYRKMLLAMVDDIRVILVKLADRLHNMRTLQHLPEERRVRIARETMDIYAPLAGRLGMSKMKNELEDLAFQYLEPAAYKELVARVEAKRKAATEFIEKMKATVTEKLAGRGHRGHRSRGASSASTPSTRSCAASSIDLDQVYDFVALRILVNTIPDCYAALGVLHNQWRPVPGRIKDFIAMPRPNGYQSLHTSVIGEEGQPLEIQIRTREMHRVAEEGIAAHWKYKEGRSGPDKDDQAFSWLRQLLEWQQEVKDPHEFLNSLKLDLYPEEVYCFTPGGEVKTLPRGASPIDFAYAVHTEVGHQCVGARVNGKMVPLRYKLKNGDIVEILTAAGHNPSRDWLTLAVTNKARAKIRHYLNVAEKQAALEIGKKHFERELKRYDLSLKKLAAEPAEGGSPGPGAGGGHASSTTSSPRSATARSRMRQVLQQLVPRGEARGPAAPGEEAAPHRRGEAAAAGGRGAGQGQGRRRPPDLPGQVLQPDHGRAHRGLHHPRQGGFRPLPELPQRAEPALRPRAAHRGGVGPGEGGRRARLRRAPLRGGGGPARPARRHHRRARGHERRHPQRRGADLRRPDRGGGAGAAHPGPEAPRQGGALGARGGRGHRRGTPGRLAVSSALAPKRGGRIPCPENIVTSKDAPKPIGPYTQAVISGGFLFCSGQVALDPATGEVVAGDVAAQTEQVLKNLLAVLQEAKMGPENVVKTTVFLRDMADFPKMNEVYARYLGKEPPARTTVAVVGLPKDVAVEIDLIAGF